MDCSEHGWTTPKHSVKSGVGFPGCGSIRLSSLGFSLSMAYLLPTGLWSRVHLVQGVSRRGFHLGEAVADVLHTRESFECDTDRHHCTMSKCGDVVLSRYQNKWLTHSGNKRNSYRMDRYEGRPERFARIHHGLKGHSVSLAAATSA